MPLDLCIILWCKAQHPCSSYLPTPLIPTHLIHLPHHAPLNRLLSLPPPPPTHTYPTSPRDPPSLTLSSSNPSVAPVNLSTSVQSILASLNILFQCKIIFHFFSGLFSHLSNSSHHPNTISFVNPSFLNLNTCSIISNTLLSTFHLTDLTPNLALTFFMFSCLLTTSQSNYVPLLRFYLRHQHHIPSEAFTVLMLHTFFLLSLSLTNEPIQLIQPSVPQVKPSATSRMSRATIHAYHPMNFSQHQSSKSLPALFALPTPYLPLTLLLPSPWNTFPL